LQLHTHSPSKVTGSFPSGAIAFSPGGFTTLALGVIARALQGFGDRIGYLAMGKAGMQLPRFGGGKKKGGHPAPPHNAKLRLYDAFSRMIDVCKRLKTDGASQRLRGGRRN